MEQHEPEHVDVLIVGAGLSGIGAAWRVAQQHPGRSYAILEARDAVGGTWDLFRFPGIRSDSDMFTLSYPFRPWAGSTALGDGASIRDYIRDTAVDGGIERHIRFGTRVLGASWSTGEARWTVLTRASTAGGRARASTAGGRARASTAGGRARASTAGGRADAGTWTCAFLYVCAGYYDYGRGHQPEFAGVEDFAGRLVHPQFWPADLDRTGRRVVVIGSGATAVTLVPAMTDTAAHVTMLQRSPSYLTVLPATDGIADALRRRLPAGLAHRIVRAKNILLTQAFYQLARRRPERVKALLRGVAVKFLKDPAYVDEHFTPTYQPWDQRLCVVPDGDLFRAVRAGRASVVTGHIDRFVESGVRLVTGEVLPADVVVSATGLSLLPLGGLELTVDGEPVDLGDTVVYRGLLLGGVPNLAFCFGYTNASWTLRADLSSRYVCRLLSFMDRHGHAIATPDAPATTGPNTIGRSPLLDLTSNYVQRAADRFPKQGDRAPWTVRQNYLLDALRTGRRADVRRDMTFTGRTVRRAPARRAEPASPPG